MHVLTGSTPRSQSTQVAWETLANYGNAVVRKRGRERPERTATRK
jgi:hypothetical protein